jgi:hypothetical protein
MNHQKLLKESRRHVFFPLSLRYSEKRQHFGSPSIVCPRLEHEDVARKPPLLPSEKAAIVERFV